jgi:hypothetical protein
MQNSACEILLFLDLDDTLFQTRDKNPAGHIPATQSADPDKASYMSAAQQALFDLFRHSPRASIIPVSARDRAQYQRTFLARQAEISTRVLYFGGLISHEDSPDPDWQARMAAAYRELPLSVSELHRQAAELTEKLADFRLHDVDGYYLALKATRDCPPDLREEIFGGLAQLCPPGYALHRNGRAMSLYPACIDKRHAVAYLLERHRPALALGAGDSLSDLGFMQLCDFRLVPAGSQLDAALAAASKTR